MNEITAPSIEPSYIVPLALKEAPFSATDDVRFFFKGEQIEQRFNLLLHLVRASNKVALLFAEQGLGKSVLLSQLHQAMGDDLRICRIDAEPSITSAALTLQCLRAYGVDENEIQSSQNHTELLNQRCLRLQNLNIKPLLFVDDVERLSGESLNTLLDWLSWQENEQFLIQAVLTAKSAMTELNTIHGRIQRVDLPALTSAELSSYLMHRLTAAGYQGDIPFSAKLLAQIFKQSEGKPELINQLAHQKLLGVKSIAGAKVINFGTLLKWLGVGLAVTLMALLLAFQDKINSLFTSTEDVELNELSELLPEQTVATIIAEPEPDLEPADIEKAAEKNPEKQGRTELEALLAELPDTKITEPDAKKDTTSQTPVNISDNDTVEVEPEENKFQNTWILQQDHEWILQQDNTYYTFQLVGSWDEQKVAEFSDKYGLEGDVATFNSKRNGRIWYALIYGVYESKDLAIQASSRWAAPLNTIPTWLRRFDSIQQQIKK